MDDERERVSRVAREVIVRAGLFLVVAAVLVATLFLPPPVNLIAVGVVASMFVIVPYLTCVITSMFGIEPYIKKLKDHDDDDPNIKR